jgi:murein DD-endopeptidase MepM/ murein hydrolase activator NlpD
VNINDHLGFSGDSGNATGEPHLHLEVKSQSSPGQSYNQATYENPEDYLGTEFDENGNRIENDNC